MNSSILIAIESLCDDIANNTNLEDNKKRAEAVISLAFAGIFTPAEYDDEYDTAPVVDVSKARMEVKPQVKSYRPINDGVDWWRNIPGYNEKYQVNRLGEIRRILPSGLVRDMTPYRKSGKKHRNRLFVKLTIDGKRKEVAVLKIIAESWFGKPPANTVPYHKNGIVTDNRVDNIGFIDRKRLGKQTGSMANKRKTVFKVGRNGDVIEIYSSAREAAKANYMSYQAVLDRCHNKIKNPFALNNYTFCFEY